FSSYTVANSTLSIAVGDLNGDGKPDLAVGTVANNVSILFNDSNALVCTFQPAVGYAAGTNPNAVAVGDLNRDGKADLAVANCNSNDVSILLGNGDGTFQPAVNYAAGTGPYSVAAA